MQAIRFGPSLPAPSARASIEEWVLVGGTDGLALRRGSEPVEEFGRIGAVAPPGWLDAARGERRCLADGRAVAAVVRAKIARP